MMWNVFTKSKNFTIDIKNFKIAKIFQIQIMNPDNQMRDELLIGEFRSVEIATSESISTAVGGG